MMRAAVGLVLTALILFLTLSVFAQDQPRWSAPEVFESMGSFLADSPATDSELEEMLRRFGFVQVGPVCTNCSLHTWRYSTQNYAVALEESLANFDKRFVVSLLPASPRPVGDATLAALISKASASFFDSGDSIELVLSARRSTKERFSFGYSLSDTLHLDFNFPAGTWWKTSRVIEWARNK